MKATKHFSDDLSEPDGCREVLTWNSKKLHRAIACLMPVCDCVETARAVRRPRRRSIPAVWSI